MNLNAAHLHVAINHLPIIGLPVALVLLAWSTFTKNEGMRRFALGFTVLVAVATIATQLSGEPAEEFIEHLPFFSESAVHSHEESAEVTTILAALSGLLALVQLVWSGAKANLRKMMGVVTMLLLALASVGAAVTGFKGGEIRHEEFRAAPAAGGQETGSAENGESGEEGEEGEKDSD